MAKDKFRSMKLRPKAKPPTAQAWDAPRSSEPHDRKRTGNGRRKDTRT